MMSSDMPQTQGDSDLCCSQAPMPQYNSLPGGAEESEDRAQPILTRRRELVQHFIEEASKLRSEYVESHGQLNVQLVAQQEDIRCRLEQLRRFEADRSVKMNLLQEAIRHASETTQHVWNLKMSDTGFVRLSDTGNVPRVLPDLTDNLGRTVSYTSMSLISPHAEDETALSRLTQSMKTRVSQTFTRNFDSRLFFLRDAEEVQFSILGPVVTSRQFEIFCLIVIGTHAIFMGIVADYESRNPRMDKSLRPFYVRQGDNIFLVWYALEIAMKLSAWRCNFFTCPDWRWNVFDVFCVMPFRAIFDAMFGKTPDGSSYSFVRVLRILKMTRMLRVIRVMRFFGCLRMMLQMIVGSLGTFFWTLVMLVTLLYMFAIIFLMGMAGYLEENTETTSEEHVLLERYWGSIDKAMNVLYMAIAGGIDWSVPADPLKELGFHYFYVFVFYITFFFLAVLNVLTGMFCEAAMDIQSQQNEKSDDPDITEQALKVLKILQEFEGEGCYGVTWDEVESCVEVPAVKTYLAMLDMTVADLSRIYVNLQGPEEERLSSENLVQGCMKSEGDLRRKDLVVLSSGYNALQRQLKTFEKYIGDSLQVIKRRRLYADEANMVGL